MNRKNIIISGISLLFLILVLLFGDDINSMMTNENRNYTCIDEQYECDNAVIYPHNYYYDKEKNLYQIELVEINYSPDDSHITYTAEEKKNSFSIKIIEDDYISNIFSSARQKKTIIQISDEKCIYHQLNIYQNEKKLYDFVIDQRDYTERKLIEKGLDYFADLRKVEKKINEGSVNSNEMSEYMEEKIDTDFYYYDLLNDDEW